MADFEVDVLGKSDRHVIKFLPYSSPSPFITKGWSLLLWFNCGRPQELNRPSLPEDLGKDAGKGSLQKTEFLPPSCPPLIGRP